MGAVSASARPLSDECGVRCLFMFVLALAMALMLAAASFVAIPACAYAAPNLTAGGTSLQTQATSGTFSVNVNVKYGQSEARGMLSSINSLRQSEGAAALTYDYELERIAMKRAVETALYYKHELPDGTGNKVFSRFSYSAAAENIYISPETASAAFEGWCDSSGHYANMISRNCTAIGIGHAVVGGVHSWVQVFSKPAVDTTATTANNSWTTETVKLANSIVTQRSASASTSSITLHLGESISLPAVTAGLKTSGTSFVYTGTVPVIASASWSSSDSSVASVTGGKVVAGRLGTATLTAKVLLGEAAAYTTVQVKVVPWNLANATIQPIAGCTYNGSAKKPAPVVTFGSKTLDASTDYTVAYRNNVNAGTATVTVTGKGNYTGSTSTTFAIARASIGGAGVTVSNKTYTGTALKPAPTVKLGQETLVADTHYSVAYKNNVNAGTATVIVTGKGNYTGSASTTFKIARASIAKAIVKVSNKKYTGSPLKPAPTVKLGKKTLKANTHYKVAYKNNVKAGTATVIVSGKGNYAGRKLATFKIVKPVRVNASKVKIAKIKNRTYTAKAVAPAIVAKYKGKKLVKGRDFTVKYANNKKIGKARAIVTFKGNFRGKRTVTFKIVAPKVGKPKITYWYKSSSYSRLDWESGSNSSGTQLKITGGGNASYNQHLAGTWGYGYCQKGRLNSKVKFSIRSYKNVGKKRFYSKWVVKTL